MAFLNNSTQTLRFQLTLADRESRPPGAAASPSIGRVLSRIAVEHFDQKDKSFWPFVRLPACWFDMAEVQALVDAAEQLIRGERAGFAFRSQIASELGLQVGRDDEGGGFSAEVGVDLQRFLGQYSGAAGQPGESLALFRFATGQPELVSFADQLRTEVRELLERNASHTS